MQTELQFDKFQKIMASVSWPDFMPEHRTGFRIADKECHRNYVSISKEQHWRSPAKKLEEEPGNKITGLTGKNPKVRKN